MSIEVNTTMLKFRTILHGVSAAALVVAGATAQPPQTANRLMRSDNSFITAAAQGGMAEVELGRLAVQRAADPTVKQFGQHMIDDHTKANDELKQIATRKGVSVPSEVSARQKGVIEKLSQLNGAEFDRAYMQDMVQDHQQTAAEFQREADKGSDADLKAFAGKVLPTIQEHLQMARSTNAQLKH